MKSKKKRIILTILALTGVVLTIWLIISLVADFRYRSLVARTVDGVEASLRSDAAFADTTITRDDGCGRGVFKLGAGAKTCRSAIIVSAVELSADEARILVEKTVSTTTKSTAKAYNQKRWNDNFTKMNPGSSVISSAAAFDLRNITGRPVSQCNISANYSTTASRNGQSYIDDTTLGDLEIRLSCSNTDWWTRNVLNKFYYPFNR